MTMLLNASSSPVAQEHISLHDNAASSSTSSSSSVIDEHEHEDDDNDDEDPWALMSPEVWTNLGGNHDGRGFIWKEEQDDLVQLFGMSLKEEY